jgi:hypothetical protein
MWIGRLPEMIVTGRKEWMLHAFPARCAATLLPPLRDPLPPFDVGVDQGGDENQNGYADKDAHGATPPLEHFRNLCNRFFDSERRRFLEENATWLLWLPEPVIPKMLHPRASL